jgi:hypothetical protein
MIIIKKQSTIVMQRKKRKRTEKTRRKKKVNLDPQEESQFSRLNQSRLLQEHTILRMSTLTSLALLWEVSLDPEYF